ncbi:response regulator [Adhaeribacter pallidiroseus]|uniref:Chemotaxis response regulator protein-glutamate methylesterase n=1 Tax=Adhaeribacter pallidiroseus TaxID=2072847 RepID=A0A369QJA5_9BACT|nr:response regulator [Adhaeribacter pallidiroseus]RDC65013.1 Chemotaxis response regulator protein-glutamate methylesterase [Adhaeribacter pallidiroseus]
MKTVMLVDDSMIANFIMKKVISNLDESLQVCDYIDSQKALGTLSEINPTLIFLDLNMPNLDGWQFLEGMMERNMSNKVYILTSSTSELDRQRSSAYTNVVSFLNKPLAQEKVAAILKAAS